MGHSLNAAAAALSASVSAAAVWNLLNAASAAAFAAAVSAAAVWGLLNAALAAAWAKTTTTKTVNSLSLQQHIRTY